MKCLLYADWIDDFVDATLPPHEGEELRAHLIQCPDCRDRVRTLQSLLCRASALPKRIPPQNDLWPGIGRRICLAGLPEKPSRPSFWKWQASPAARGWRIAATILIGAVLIWAAVRMTDRRPGPNMKHSPAAQEQQAAPSGPQVKTATNQVPSGARLAEARPGRAGAGESGGETDQPAANPGPSPCGCEPAPEIAVAIERVLRAGDDYAPMRAMEVVSERLFNLAVQNEGDFFLFKTSLDVLPFPRVSDAIRERYRKWFVLHPLDSEAAYLYAYSLYGKDTPEMVRLMHQLIAKDPGFPWPHLALAHLYENQAPQYKDPAKVQSFVTVYMRLCPDSPEPLTVLRSIVDKDFLFGTVEHMRELLARRLDTRSLLLYANLWYLEGAKQATGLNIAQVRNQMASDLKRLRPLATSMPSEFRTVLRGGYHEVGNYAAAKSLLLFDMSYEGRLQSVMAAIQDWDEKNPKPPADAPAESRIAYWENRLKASDSWVKKAPEAADVWLDRLRTLAELKNHPEAEFVAAAEKLLSLDRAGAADVFLFEVAELYANRGIQLDRVPGIIADAIAFAEQRALSQKTDLADSPAERSRFIRWRFADKAQQALFEAYLGSGRTDKARSLLTQMEAGLMEWQRVLAGKSEADVLSLIGMELPARQSWRTDAHVRLRAAEKR